MDGLWWTMSIGFREITVYPAGALFWVAGVAQLVEHNVANVVVVGSNPIARSSPVSGWKIPESNRGLLRPFSAARRYSL